MDFKGWDGLDTRQWWVAVLLIAGPLLVGAGSTGRTTTAIIAAGAVVWAIGEWIQHPYQELHHPGGKVTHYHRVWRFPGLIFNVLGIALVVFAVYRFNRLGGQLF